jgi:formylglycine-generating enzyme required for sulfatase activity
MEKKTLRFLFMMSVVFGLLSLSTAARGKQMPLSKNGVEKPVQRDMRVKGEAERQKAVRKRADNEEQYRGTMEESQPGRQVAQAEGEQKTGVATEGQPPAEAQVGADGMVAVPAGEFSMGCNEEVDSECEDDEKPQRKVNVPAFRIDRTEVTVEAYRQCVDARRCTLPDTQEEGRAIGIVVGLRNIRSIVSTGIKRKRFVRGQGSACRPVRNGKKRHAGQTDVCIRREISTQAKVMRYLGPMPLSTSKRARVMVLKL